MKTLEAIEVIEYLRENLRIEASSSSEYSGASDGPMYRDYTTVSLWLGDEKISETSL